jgi:hypothetical protein
MKHKRGRRTIRNSFFSDLFGPTETTYSIKGRKITKRSSISRWLGYKIYENADGGFSVPELDSSVFDTKRDAQRFISAWKKESNPGKYKHSKQLLHTTIIIKNPAKWFSR